MNVSSVLHGSLVFLVISVKGGLSCERIEGLPIPTNDVIKQTSNSAYVNENLSFSIVWWNEVPLELLTKGDPIKGKMMVN